MRRLAWFLGFTGLLLVAASAVFPAPLRADVSFPLPQVEKLPNGLTVAWLADASLPVVDVGITIERGDRDDPQGRSGTAELLSAVLDRGAGGMSALEIARSIESLGASRLISAGDEAFTVGLHGLAQDGPLLLEMLARIALHPDLPIAEVEREKARIIDRWKHMGDHAETLAMLAASRIGTAGTVYGRGGLAAVSEFQKVGRQDVERYHRENFVPPNATLLIVGRFDPNVFRKRVEELFGTWKGDSRPRSSRVYRDAKLGSVPPGGIVLINRPGIPQAQVRFVGLGPSIQHPDRHAIAVGNAILGEYFNSRLNSVLREQMGLTYGISSGFSYSKELGRFVIATSSRNESIGRVIKQVLQVVRGMRNGPIGDSEVAQARDYLAGGYPLGLSTSASIASRWLGRRLFGLPEDDLNQFVPAIRSVTTEQVRQAMRRHLDPDGLKIVIAGDERPIADSLKAAGFKRFRRVRIRELRE